jgi:CheY-like chemotaxis protein
MAEAHEKTILVVDDEPNVRCYLQTILEDAGFNVETAADGEEALEKIKAKPPDFISLDLVMPRKTGRKLFYELKKNNRWSRIPVLIVTAHARDEMGKSDLEDLLGNRAASGAGAYLEKPINPESYVRCIRRTLGVDEPPAENEGTALKDELRTKLSQASPESLRRALEALEK